jgi:hypothetical protein
MTAERMYRSLLVLYPRRFREEYGDELLEACQALRQARPRFLQFWLFLLADVGRSALSQQLERFDRAEARFTRRWIGACAAGVVVCGAIGSAATWSFSYFYHPFLEGTAFVPWAYGALVGAGLGLVQAGVLRRRLRLRSRWVAVTAASAAVALELASAIGPFAGSAASGVLVGLIVAAAQWLMLRTHVRRPASWVVLSAAALSLAVAAGGSALQRAVAGVNPISTSVMARRIPQPDGVDRLFRVLYAPASWDEFAYGVMAMATIGLIIGTLTAGRALESRIEKWELRIRN